MGVYRDQDYPAPDRVQLSFEIPLSEMIVDFFDDLKSGPAVTPRWIIQFLQYRPGNLVKLEVLVGGEPVDALAAIVHKEEAYHKGQSLVTKLKETHPDGSFSMSLSRLRRAGGVISRANCESIAQRRAGQVLWWGHYTQEKIT